MDVGKIVGWCPSLQRKRLFERTIYAEKKMRREPREPIDDPKHRALRESAEYERRYATDRPLPHPWAFAERPNVVEHAFVNSPEWRAFARLVKESNANDLMCNMWLRIEEELRYRYVLQPCAKVLYLAAVCHEKAMAHVHEMTVRRIEKS